MFRAFLLKNVSGCGKEGAKYPLFLLIKLFVSNMYLHDVKVLEFIFKMSGRRAF